MSSRSTTRRPLARRIRLASGVLVVLGLSALVGARPAAAQESAPGSGGAGGSGGRRPAVIGAFVDSLKLLAIEHGIRITFQEKTRRELDGPFWRDYRRSIRVPRDWEDSDTWWVNYIGHPIHGAAAGYLWLDHGATPAREIGLSREYWVQRAHATAWSAAYSLQFELGPLSEASIGNVGMQLETTGWVDHVVTPVGAFGLMVAEDALDRFLVQWIERRTSNRVWRASMRLIFNPARTLSNTARGRVPWHRDGRPVGWR